VESDTVGFVEGTDEPADFGAEDALERLVTGSDDIDGDFALAERGGDFEADEACR